MLTLEQMTPEQKLRRGLCARRLGDQDDIDFTLELVKNEALGALQMTFDESKRPELVKRFREAADYPLIMVGDMAAEHPGGCQQPGICAPFCCRPCQGGKGSRF